MAVQGVALSASMADPAGLSEREREIAGAYAEGLGFRDIAARLHIAPATVRTHVSTVYRKLGVSSKIELWHRLPDTAPSGTPSGAPLRLTRLRVGVLAVAEPRDEPRWTGIATTFAAELAAALGQCRELEAAAPVACVGPGADLRTHARRAGLGYMLLVRASVPDGAPRLLVQLAEGRTAAIRWSACQPLPPERPGAGLPALATRVARQLGGLGGLLVTVERQRLATEPPCPADPHELYLRAGEGLDGAGRERTLACAGLAERCTALAPRFARGWLMLGWLRNEIVSYGWAEPAPDHCQREDAAFRRAVDLDPRDMLGPAHLAVSRARLGAVAEARRLVAHAAEAAESEPDAKVALTLALSTIAGDPARALTLIDRARDECPEAPPSWDYMEARAAFLAGDCERALEASVTAPHTLPKLVFQMLASAEAGETREAAVLWADLRRLVPHFRFGWYAATLPIVHPQALAPYQRAAARVRAAVATTAGAA